MPASTSIIGQCGGCCDSALEQGLFVCSEIKTISANITAGFIKADFSDYPKMYKRVASSGSIEGFDGSGFGWLARVSVNYSIDAILPDTNTPLPSTTADRTYYRGAGGVCATYTSPLDSDFSINYVYGTVPSSDDFNMFAICPGFSAIPITLSEPYSLDDFRSIAIFRLPQFSNLFTCFSSPTTSLAFLNFGTDAPGYGSSVSVGAARYRFSFRVPQGGSGQCYLLTWVERFIPEAGVGLTSLEIISAGVYRPTVTLSAPPTGGTQARAIAVMSSTGTISSIRITNPGSGYTSAPTVTVQSAINGGTSSTGWTATLTDGKVTAISGGSAGDYLPTLSFSGGGGSGAAATVTTDSTGGLASITFSSLGSAYASAPSVSISSKVSGATAATLHLHLGTETVKCTEWDGTTPSGYDPNTSSTWPTLPSASPGYFEIPVPSSEGTTTVANVRAFYDCSSCP